MKVALWMTALSLLCSATQATACDRDTGARTQYVALSWDGRELSSWDATAGQTERVDLPNGLHLGVRVRPASAEKYSMLYQSAHHVPELVEIELFDLGGKQPKQLTRTWGGSSSIQGYGAQGGADRVEALGSPGIVLTLMKPICADPRIVLQSP